MAQGRRSSGALSLRNMGMLLVAVLLTSTTLPKLVANDEEEAQLEKESSSNATAIGPVSASAANTPSLKECIPVIPQLKSVCTADVLYGLLSFPPALRNPFPIGRKCCRLSRAASSFCLRQFIKSFFRTHEWPAGRDINVFISFLNSGCGSFP